MKKLFARLLLPLALFFISFCVNAQNLNWDVNLVHPKTFTSLNPWDDGVATDQMWQLSVKDLMSMAKSAGSSYGIEGTLTEQSGHAKASVYLYDKTVMGGKGHLIFQSYIDNKTMTQGSPSNNGNAYKLGNWLAWWPQAGENETVFNFNDYWSSNDARSSMIAAAFYNYNEKFGGWNQAESNGTALIPYNQNDNKFPVIIELEVYKAKVTGLFLPGLGLIEPGYFRPPFLDIIAEINNTSLFSVNFKLTIKNPNSPNQVSFSDIVIGLSQFNSTHFNATQTIPASDIPYSNNNFSLSIGTTPRVQPWWSLAKYDITVTDRNGQEHSFPNQLQFLFNYMGCADCGIVRSYNITSTTYSGLPVFTLSGGMSAEYCVEKSLAALSSGISETWDVRNIDGNPDLKGGAPEPVWCNSNKFDFVEESVNKTVQLYNNLGADTKYNTVIIGAGIAQVPYLTHAMKAPFLPLQFLLNVHSVSEVKRTLDTANRDGFSAYAMMGIDPAITDAGIAWIKLRELPDAYKKFLADHQVQNVIIMGLSQDNAKGEAEAQQVWLGNDVLNPDYAEGSMYLMTNDSVRQFAYRNLFDDYYRLNVSPVRYYMDWEGGVSNDQVANIKGQLPANVIDYVIQSPYEQSLYKWGLDIQLAMMKKNGITPSKLSMNEYLIGYPGYELYTSTLPYLYWQGAPYNETAFSAYTYSQFKTQIPPNQFKNLPVYIQAKADRSELLADLKNYFSNVTMDSWQQADVWDPSDGMTSPCELVATAITQSPDGAKDFAAWNKSLVTFDINDFTAMIANSVPVIPPDDPRLFPKPSVTTDIARIDQAGLSIGKALYDPNPYWQLPVTPDQIKVQSVKNSKINGFLDGEYPPGNMRKQSIVTARFELTNPSDEYDLQVGYKFNVNDKSGLSSYQPSLGEEQNMGCFEFTSMPYNNWFDTPNRMMARKGAVLILNGGVYDFDHNGLPGVVPFIKKNSLVKAQPQVLSYKGEGALAWSWGTTKQVKIVSRLTDIPGTGLPASMKTLFQKETNGFPNAVGGMTYMSGQGLYDVTALQPQWMLDYKPFPPYYLGDTANRCYFAPISLGCRGTEAIAPVSEGWNNCSSLQSDAAIQRFSSLAYQNYQGFDAVPNARTFVGIKGTELQMGVISGDLGVPGSLDVEIATKTLGMRNYEVSQFRLAQGYDQLINLQGGSASSMWLNGHGPLHQINGYPLANSNQGPYFSRLGSSYIMLVPKLHTELINKIVIKADPGAVPVFDNSNVNFNYSDEVDLDKPKAFIDLSPCKDSLNRTDGNYGLVAGNFTMSGTNANKNGGILFYAGEDMYYPDTKGLSPVQPQLRNLVVAGVGLVLPGLRDSIMKLPVSYGIDVNAFRQVLASQNISAYYIKVYGGRVIEAIFSAQEKGKYLTGDHRFYIAADPEAGFNFSRRVIFKIDGADITASTNGTSFFSHYPEYGFLNMGTITHAYIGAVNLDGRFLTGDIAMKAYNYLFASGLKAWNWFEDNLDHIDVALESHSLPNYIAAYKENGVYAVQCLETTGQHVFGISPIAGKKLFYGLRLNNFEFKKKASPAKKPSKAKKSGR